MSTNVVSNPMGLKRICASCGARFYDLNKRPIICPECSAEFTGEVKLKSRRGRTPSDVKKEDIVPDIQVEKDPSDILTQDPEVEVVSLDDAETSIIEEDDDSILVEDALDDIPELVETEAIVEDDLEAKEILLDDEV